MKATQLFLDLFRIKAPPIRGSKKDADLTGQASGLLIKAGAEDLARRVEVVWNSRLISTAGQARFRQDLVVLNPRLRDFSATEVDRTLRHELAHLLANSRAKRRRIAPHGNEWRQACYDLGLQDETRCHNLPLPRRVVNYRHAYVCGQCGEVYRRVRPFRRRVACLACCRAHNRGRFHERFSLRKLPVKDGSSGNDF